jgi:hypothetical protein
MGNPPRKPTASPDENPPDPLGKVIEQHGITWAAVIAVTLVLCAVGAGILAYGGTRNPRSTLWLVVGGIVCGLGVCMFLLNARNTGRRLELRKKGVRYVDGGNITEIFWSDIVDVEVERLDATNMGLATKFKNSNDAVSPSSLLTKTEWTVTIHADNGRKIPLKPAFFRIVPDPRALISNLKLRAGL